MYKIETITKKPVQIPKGHEAYLKGIELSKSTLVVEYLDGGDDDVGTIKTSDKYTISLRLTSGLDVVIYKHAIRRFYTTKAAQ